MVGLERPTTRYKLPLGIGGFASLVFMASGCGYPFRVHRPAITAHGQNLALPLLFTMVVPTRGVNNYAIEAYINTANLDSPLICLILLGPNQGWPSFMGHVTAIDGKEALLLRSGPPGGSNGPSCYLPTIVWPRPFMG